MKSITEIPSFLNAQGTPDLGAVRACAGRLAAAGWTRIGVAGLFSEYPGLTRNECTLLIRAAAEGAPGAEIVSGALDVATDKAANRIREHAGAGCHTHIVTPAHAFSMNRPEEMELHLRRLLCADPEGRLIVACGKELTGAELPAGLPESLADSGRLEVFLYPCDPVACAGFAEDARVLVREELALSGLSMRPVISRLAVLFPESMREPARLDHGVRTALIQLLSSCRHPAAAVKRAASDLGICRNPATLPPYAAPDAGELIRVRDALAAILHKGGTSHDR